MAASRNKKKNGNRRAFALLLALILLLCGAILAVRMRSHSKYEPLIRQYARQYGVPEAFALAVAETESHFKADAVSRAGALGLMQITPETFEWLQTKTGESLPTDALFDPEVSVRYGVFFLSMLLERFGDTDTAAAAYNAGMNAVARWLENPEYSDDGVHLKNIPIDETRYYVVKIQKAFRKYNKS
ncbi:MAG: lytic transglycosylase domain-containing protein [Clostridia bacterium]|nr:lytic transglycosylase domain-containing protein [Clostridia bacterium]